MTELGAPSMTRVDSFLAFDFGTRRVGVAVGNSLLRRVTPLRTLALEGDARLRAIDALVAVGRPAALLVGVPSHPDGADHQNPPRAGRFGRPLLGRFGRSVRDVDERYTSTEAIAAGAADVDAAAAALILDQYLRGLG
jgi:putative Holliday junction resolvase